MANPLSSLTGSSDEEFRGIMRAACNAELVQQIPAGIKKIHCEVDDEKRQKELMKVFWPDFLPDFEEFVELFKDFKPKSILTFITKTRLIYCYETTYCGSSS